MFVAPTFSHILERTRDCAAIGIDIPVGLSDSDRRRPDLEARKALRPLRHNSVFPAPLRPVLSARDYGEACAISETAHVAGKKISKQTYALMYKIAEVDKIMTPELQNRVVEIHPEVCFWALNDREPMSHPKRSPAGEFERIRLLDQVFADDLASQQVPTGAAPDDLYDACAAAWTAARYARGEHGTLPEYADRDSRGLRMEIMY